MRKTAHAPTPHARLLACRSGVAAVEFALVLPVMIPLLLGLTELTTAITTDRKLALTARSISDLTSRATVMLTSDDITSVFSASAIIMQPYSSAAIKMTLSSMAVTYNASAKTYSASVDWSCASGTGATTKPTTVTYAVPVGYQTDGTHFLLSETTLPYKPIFGAAITGTINLAENAPWPNRNMSKVTLPAACLSGCVCPNPT